MNKLEFVRKITEKAEGQLNQRQTNVFLIALEEAVKDVVISGDEATIPGICKVKSKLVPTKTGTVMRGANKGEKWTKPEHMEATVKIVPSLKKVFE